jgi:hypothetical protein
VLEAKELAALANVSNTTMSEFLQPNESSPPAARQAIMKLPTPVRVRAPGRRSEIASIKDALGFIDRDLPSELKRLPRWTFAHALLLEAERTGKSRDLKAAVRQLRQALGNEKWLEEDEAKNP